MTTFSPHTQFSPNLADVGWDQLAPQATSHLSTTAVAETSRPSPAAASADFKQQIIATLGQVAQRFDWILSATLTGSFLRGAGLEGISDIDFVVVVDRLNAERMQQLQNSFREALEPVLARANYSLRINPTLGPLKFNDERTAVLHLMLYSLPAHIEHVIHSPFTCLDWQRSQVWFKRPLGDIYPVFGLQPRHFISARRSIQDYLRDYRAGIVSFRELACDERTYREVRRDKPMTIRDRHEFAYHILRFLMQNTLKLLLRRNEVPEGELLLDQFSLAFGDCGGLLRPLYHELEEKKRSLDFREPLPQVDERLEAWIGDYERQFRNLFFTDARRHVLFRHAPTALNSRGHGERDRESISADDFSRGKAGWPKSNPDPVGDAAPRFLGRRNPDIEPLATDSLAPLVKAIEGLSLGRVFSSPLARCQQSLAALANAIDNRWRGLSPLSPSQPDNGRGALRSATATCLLRPCLDARLEEIDYGHCEGLTAVEARQQFPRLAAGWDRGDDVRFPDGECTADVARRLEAFIDGQWDHDGPDTLTCTHNVVLRCLVGLALNIPQQARHRLRIPHLAPISVIQTRRHGWFVDLDEETEREIFRDFAGRPSNAVH
jgi:broad specificity phosphatase PhoE